MPSRIVYAVIASSVVLLAACSSPVKLNDAKVPVQDLSSQQGANRANPNTVSTIDTTSMAMDPLHDPQGVLARRSVYFDYDRFVVKEDYRSLIESHAKYLRDQRARKIVIQGNADERGGSEYNLALGQKRAEAVRRSLSLLGVEASQMEAVSFGKEKPKALGHDEAAYAENRRADIVY